MSERQAFAGIDIGATNIKFGLTDQTGKVLHKEQRPTLAAKGAEPLMHLVTNIAESLLFQAAEDDYQIKHLGVGTPGAVNNRTGQVIGICPNLDGWQGMQVGAILRERLNMPVHVDNDVNAVAIAEARFGAGAGHNAIVCVALGTGVGGGVILDGKLWRGATHSAGELGHISINPDGPVCGCSARGCIEAYCASPAIVKRAADKLKAGMTPVFEGILEGSVDNLTIKKLFAAARKGDAVALEVIEETADLLAVGLAGIVNLLNPDIVIIGGGIADGGGGFVDAVSAGIRRRAFESATINLRVARASLGNDAGFVGAGILGEIAR